MQRIIKNGQIVDESWHLLPKETAFEAVSYTHLTLPTKA